MDTGLAVHPLADLHESPDNPRTISDERFDALKYALEKDSAMLEARPIIATPDGEVVAGNMRLRALKELGWTEAPVFVADLNEDQKREWMLRDNQEFGDWVPEQLGALMAAHKQSDGDMALLGFADNQVEALLKAHEQDDAGGGGGGEPDPTATEPDVWGIIVDCESEEQQAELMDELASRDLDVRALIP